ncbi:MAG: arylsulfatase [Phycisphaerales bacterium]|nr:MAG: arylsulfatase [Phycisphaerales bacterium]
MNRRVFLRQCISATGVALTVVPWLEAAETRMGRQRPNIVLILADDMGYGDLACQNPESKIPTPNLDQLAAEGVRFTDAHSPSAVCSPTRYGVLTGRYAWRTRLKKGVLWCWDNPLIDADRLTVGKLLQAHGYDTACIGKWHLGWVWPTTDGNDPVGMGKNTPDAGENVDFNRPIADGPTTRGFDYYFGTDVPNFPPYCFIENDHTVGIPTVPKPGNMFGSPGPMLEGWRLEDILPALAQKAEEYVDAKGGRSQNEAFGQTRGNPFFLYMPLTAPHTPIAPNADSRGKSRAGAYGDFVYEVDHVVGRVLEALDRNGFSRDTLVIFTSDNGSPGRDGTDMSGKLNSVRAFGHNPSHVYRGIKADAWEGGHRVPFLARWPGETKPGTVCDNTICHVDLIATCAEVIGANLPQDAGEDSFSFLPYVLDRPPDGPVRNAVVHHSGNGVFAVRRGKWKFIDGVGSGGWSGKGDGLPGQLYNMEHDSAEQNNLYQNPAHQAIIRELRDLLECYKRQGRTRLLT